MNISLDLEILNFIRNNIANPVFDAIMPLITYMGSGGAIWIVTALIMLASRKYRKTGFKIAAALILSLLICNMLIKPTVARVRPYEVNTAIELIISKPTEYSFPSGHTSSSFAAATVLMLCEDRKIWVPAMVTAALIAFSRLYLYVHYPTDVICGMALGAIFAFAAVKLVDMIYLRIKKTKCANQEKT